MLKNLFKSMLPLIAATVIGFTLFACSDDDDEPQLNLSVENTTFDMHQPEGSLKLKLNVSDPNVQLSKSKLGVTKYSSSSSGGLNMSQTIEIVDLSKEDNNYYLTFHYNLGNLEYETINMGLAYDSKEIAGEITFKLRRAHEYKDIIEFKVADLTKLGKYHFPVFTFLDELGVEHMPFTALAQKDELFLVDTDGSLYPAIQKESDKTFFKITGKSSKGEICLMGIRNANYKKIYTLINKIKLNEPDQYGNEYIWLEYPFILLPEE